MPNPPAIEVLRDRLRSFLVFAKTKLSATEIDLGRLAQLRRLSDVRIRQFALGKPKVTAADLCGLLADPKVGRFDELAAAAELLRKGHLAAGLTPLGEEMGYVVEACLTLQVIGAEKMRELVTVFVTQHGGPPTAAQTATEKVRVLAEAPLPGPVARLLGNVKELWTIPANTFKILEMLNVPETPAESVCAEIEKDPGLSAQCLRVVNSANYALGAKIASIKRAVVTLGYVMTRRIVSISALTSRLGRAHGELEFDLRQFWNHSLWVAHAAALVSRAAKLGNADEHFTAGLIHDIGKLVEYQYLRAPMKQVLAAVKGGAPYPDAEAKVLGVNHATIGACLCERWRFPPLIVEAVRHHLDTPAQLEETQLPREAAVVTALCRLSAAAPSPSDVEVWSEFLRLPPDRVPEIRQQADQLSRGCLTEIFAVA